jgi:hypothetical protein
MNYKSIFKVISFNAIFFLLLLFFFEFLFTTYKATKFYKQKLIKNNRNLFQDLKSIQANQEAVVPIYPYFLLRENMFSEIKIMGSKNLSADEEIFPLSGISNNFTLFCQESDFRAEYTSDRYGFNNDDRLYNNKEIDFLFIGDSFAQGMCVNYNDTFQGNFNKKNFKTISLGYGGNGSLLEYASLREYIDVVKSKSIIWFYTENDIDEMVLEIKIKFLKKYLENENYSQNLSNKQALIDKIQNNNLKKIIKDQEKLESLFIDFNSIKIENILNLKNIKNLIRVNFKVHLPAVQKKTSDENFKIFSEIILKASNLAKEKNSNFYFVMLPLYPGVIEVKDERYYNYEKVKEIIRGLEINLLDLSDEMFKKEKNPKKFFPFERSGHYTVEGYKLAADIILSKINQMSVKN